MGGRMSRNKGKQNEYLVRDYFRSLGFIANRVPSSGASQGFKGDITLEKEGLKLKCEVKVRENEFKTIYALCDDLHSDPLCLMLGTRYAVISRDFNSLGFGTDRIAWPIFIMPDGDKRIRTVKKIFNLERLVKECDFLAVRINYKPFLFIRFL